MNRIFSMSKPLSTFIKPFSSHLSNTSSSSIPRNYYTAAIHSATSIKPPQTNNDYNAILVSLSLSMNPTHAIKLFVDKKQQGFTFDYAVLPSVMYACVRTHDFSTMYGILAEIVKRGFNYEDFLLIDEILQSGGIMDTSKLVLAATNNKGLYTINSYMTWCNRKGLHHLSFILYKAICSRGWKPNESSLYELISTCDTVGLSSPSNIHSEVIKQTFGNPSIKLNNSLVRMYFIAGDKDSATKLFHSIKYKNLATWNRLLTGLGHLGFADECLKAFDEMLISGFVPNQSTFLALLMACDHNGKVELGLSLFQKMKFQYKINPGLKHYGVIVDMLSRAGFLKEALDFIGNMPIPPNEVIWRSVLSGAAIHHDLPVAEFASAKLVH